MRSQKSSKIIHHESKLETPWRYELPSDFRANLTKAIVGFEIKIMSIEGKFKLSQNRSAEDWQSVVKHVQKIYGKINPDLVSMMIEAYKEAEGQ